jgi:hypothetical protein
MSRHHKKMHQELIRMIAEVMAYEQTYLAEVQEAGLQSRLWDAAEALSDTLNAFNQHCDALANPVDHANSSRENSRAYQAEQNAKNGGL